MDEKICIGSGSIIYIHILAYKVALFGDILTYEAALFGDLLAYEAAVLGRLFLQLLWIGR
jgi:hypothetical protein